MKYYALQRASIRHHIFGTPIVVSPCICNFTCIVYDLYDVMPSVYIVITKYVYNI
jgi:hypothetical protein